MTRLRLLMYIIYGLIPPSAFAQLLLINLSLLLISSFSWKLLPLLLIIDLCLIISDTIIHGEVKETVYILYALLPTQMWTLSLVCGPIYLPFAGGFWFTVLWLIGLCFVIPYAIKYGGTKMILYVIYASLPLHPLVMLFFYGLNNIVFWFWAATWFVVIASAIESRMAEKKQ